MVGPVAFTDILVSWALHLTVYVLPDFKVSMNPE